MKKRRGSVRPWRGSIIEKHGAFHWVYYLDGQHKSERVGSSSEMSKTAACEEANRRNAKLPTAKHSSRPRSNMSIVDFAETIYLPFVEQNKRPATYNGYFKIWSGHLKKHFGKRRLTDYEPFIATEFLTALAPRLGKNALSHIRAVMSSVFAHAVATGHLTMNPVHGAKILANPKQTPATEHYTVEEMRNILAALDSAETAQQHAVMLLAFYGLRRSEISGLKWDDTNLDAGALFVRRSAWNGKANDGAKNDKSVGEIPLGATAVKSLERWKRLSVSQKGYVFENQNGKPLELGTYGYRVLAPLFAHLKLKWKAYNSGRRGAETEMNRYTNGNSQITSHFLRHSKEVADRNYIKPLPDETKKAALAFDAALTADNRQQQTRSRQIVH